MSRLARAVINPRAGGLLQTEAAEVAEALRKAWERCGHRLDRVEIDADVDAAVDRAMAGGPLDVLFVAAGDGTVRTAVRRLLGSRAALAVLPLGTFNLLARDLDVPLDFAEAVSALAEGETTRIDVAWVDNELFLSAVAIGLGAEACAVREVVRDAGPLAWPEVLFDTAMRFADAQPIGMRLDDGRRRHRWTSHAVFIANGPFRRSGSLLMRRSSLAGGRLALYAQRNPSRWQALLTLARARLGGFSRSEVIDERLKQLTIQTRPERVLATIDGELSELVSPLEFRVQPGALRVLRPRRAPAEVTVAPTVGVVPAN